MMAVLGFALAIAGFACLSMSLAKHHRDVFGKAPSATAEQGLRVAGWLLLGLSLAASIAAENVVIGIVLWTGLLSGAALIIAMLLTYREKWKRR